MTYTADDIAQAYQIGYAQGAAKREPFTPEQAVRAIDLMKSMGSKQCGTVGDDE